MKTYSQWANELNEAERELSVVNRNIERCEREIEQLFQDYALHKRDAISLSQKYKSLSQQEHSDEFYIDIFDEKNKWWILFNTYDVEKARNAEFAKQLLANNHKFRQRDSKEVDIVHIQHAIDAAFQAQGFQKVTKDE